MRKSADVTGGKLIVVLLQSILDVSAINPLVAFYDIHGRKREMLFFYIVPDTTREFIIKKHIDFQKFIYRLIFFKIGKCRSAYLKKLWGVT
jgi:hypothetical protein